MMMTDTETPTYILGFKSAILMTTELWTVGWTLLVTYDNEINPFDWDNKVFVDGVMNFGYNDDSRLINILFPLMKIDW